MKKTRRTLLTLFYGQILLVLLIIGAFEFRLIEIGPTLKGHTQLVFIITTLMELLTIIMLPISLRLFKYKRVQQDLVSGGIVSLRLWGSVRLLLIGFLLLSNTLLYYILQNTAFGYLAIMSGLVLPFVYPTENRCNMEIGTE